jgi:hypothetical protein
VGRTEGPSVGGGGGSKPFITVDFASRFVMIIESTNLDFIKSTNLDAKSMVLEGLSALNLPHFPKC